MNDIFCGISGKQQSQSTHHNMTIPKAINNNMIKQQIKMAILGFCIPLVGLILYCTWKSERPGDAKMAGKGALVSVTVIILVILITGLIMASLV